MSGDITEMTTPARKQLNRQSSIQADSSFYSKPYGDLRARTPPVIVGSLGLGGVVEEEETRNNMRQVSSGNDFDGGPVGVGVRMRHVSGREAEEGRAGVTPPPLEIKKNKGNGEVKGGHVAAMRSRYSVLNE